MKILIVDDSQEDIRFLRKCLKNQSPTPQVLVAENYQDGLNLAIAESPDCIFLDYRLSGAKTGIELAAELKKSKSTSAIIAISELHDITFPKDFLKEGAIDFLFKESISESNIQAYIFNAIQKRTIFQKLIEQSAKNNDYISHLSHDIRSPLSTISAITSLSLEENLEKDELVKYMSQIQKTAKVALDMAQSILEISRFERLGLSLNTKLTSLSKFLQEEYHRLLPIALHKKIDFINNVEDNLLSEFDPKSMRLVISNLISNALKFTPPEKKIVLSTLRVEGQIKVGVVDEGTGIDPSMIQGLFDKTVHTTKVGIYGEKGTGLGLPIIAEIVEAHGSKLEIQSKLGEGSEFYFYLADMG